MPEITIIKGNIWEDGSGTVLARVVGNAAANITQASLSTITCKVFNVQPGYATPDTAVATPTVTIASTVYDTLQTDARWTADSTGYNFAHTLAASIFTEPDTLYRIEYKFTPVSGEVFYIVAELTSQAIRGS